MSRTYRNRKTVPKGWTVRDDGDPYYGGADRYGEEHLKRFPRREFSNGTVLWVYARFPKYRRSRWRREAPDVRKKQNKTYRSQMNHLVRIGRYEDICRPKKTEGWMSW